MNSGNYPLSRKDNIVIQEFDNEILIYDLMKNKALCLNQTSAMVWQECDGTKSVAEISLILSKKFKTNISEEIVWLALNQFKKDSLLEKNNEFTTPLDGLSRREVVKRIGFASMIALPLISSVVAPSAVQAQSGALCAGFAAPNLTCVPGNNNDLSDDGCPCNTNEECQGVCPVTSPRFCLGANTGPFCAPGNSLDLSQDCCPCTSNNECIGVCPVSIPGQPGVRFCLGGAP